MQRRAEDYCPALLLACFVVHEREWKPAADWQHDLEAKSGGIKQVYHADKRVTRHWPVGNRMLCGAKGVCRVTPSLGSYACGREITRLRRHQVGRTIRGDIRFPSACSSCDGGNARQRQCFARETASACAFSTQTKPDESRLIGVPGRGEACGRSFAQVIG